MRPQVCRPEKGATAQHTHTHCDWSLGIEFVNIIALIYDYSEVVTFFPIILRLHTTSCTSLTHNISLSLCYAVFPCLVRVPTCQAFSIIQLIPSPTWQVPQLQELSQAPEFTPPSPITFQQYSTCTVPRIITAIGEKTGYVAELKQLPQ